MKILYYILFLTLPLSIEAQKVKWEETTVNFGTVRDWNSPPATFKFTNTGNKKLMFLPQKHGREVLVRYPNRSFMPGESGVVIIHYYTGETGLFSQSVEVYTNASSSAHQLSVKGNIKSIYADALTSCPSFQDPTPVRSTEPNMIQTVDAATNRPIANAQVEVFDRGIRKAINGTNLDGVAVNWIETGNYVAVASKDGYERAEQEMAFTKRDRQHVIYMNKNSSSPQLNEEVTDLGIALNDQVEEENGKLETENRAPVQIRVEKTHVGTPQSPIINEEMDLGIALNDQVEEENGKPSIENRQSPIIHEEMDLGIALNEQVEREYHQPTTALAEPEFSTDKFRSNNVLLLLDVSGSMKEDGKMDKLKSSIRRLVLMLREVDVLTIIAYNSDSWELLPPTPVRNNMAIVALVDSLEPFGYTNGVKGMESAYESLEKQLIPNGNNQLIIATDGMFNSSRFSEQEAVQMVKDNSDKGIALSIIGFGDDKEAGRLMKKLADLGSGSFLPVSNSEDPTELLAKEIKLRSQK